MYVFIYLCMCVWCIMDEVKIEKPAVARTCLR